MRQPSLRACRGSSLPSWFGSSRAELRLRGQLSAATLRTQWRLQDRQRHAHWHQVVSSLPLLCDFSQVTAAAPVVQLNCDGTLAVSRREGSKHLVVSPAQAVCGRCVALAVPATCLHMRSHVIVSCSPVHLLESTSWVVPIE